MTEEVKQVLVQMEKESELNQILRELCQAFYTEGTVASHEAMSDAVGKILARHNLYDEDEME